ncbi:hypothetical protein [Paraburkholderia sp. WP4_3_2]|jgi:hypothetical protein|uniref:hypothetical protein n=1 Tax=Paraburkholderia sp. WP4_3_2 TaxID=2587162 RepID=UPI001612E707|nr:hypothetical protein [Paraburkholderia sp. WP4_3_2]MBB3256788.1 hypothetical protein [Paraburkholderia sp. WP4_3_2]
MSVSCKWINGSQLFRADAVPVYRGLFIAHCFAIALAGSDALHLVSMPKDAISSNPFKSRRWE